MKNPESTKRNVKACGDNGYADQQAERARELAEEFADFSDYALPEKGKHTVKLLSREMIAAKRDDDGKVIAQKYLALAWADVETHVVIDTRLYSAAVPYLMTGINRQVGGDLMGMKLSEVLDYTVTHAIDIWVDWSPDYGVQVTYFKR